MGRGRHPPAAPAQGHAGVGQHDHPRTKQRPRHLRDADRVRPWRHRRRDRPPAGTRVHRCLQDRCAAALGRVPHHRNGRSGPSVPRPRHCPQRGRTGHAGHQRGARVQGDQAPRDVAVWRAGVLLQGRRRRHFRHRRKEGPRRRGHDTKVASLGRRRAAGHRFRGGLHRARAQRDRLRDHRHHFRLYAEMVGGHRFPLRAAGPVGSQLHRRQPG